MRAVAVALVCFAISIRLTKREEKHLGDSMRPIQHSKWASLAALWVREMHLVVPLLLVVVVVDATVIIRAREPTNINKRKRRRPPAPPPPPPGGAPEFSINWLRSTSAGQGSAYETSRGAPSTPKQLASRLSLTLREMQISGEFKLAGGAPIGRPLPRLGAPS